MNDLKLDPGFVGLKPQTGVNQRIPNAHESLQGEPFASTLHQTITDMHQLTQQAELARQALAASDGPSITSEMHRADEMHHKMMEAQHNLALLYQQLQANQQKS
ncbi:MAG: hypothetical protein CL911_03000 [Deltaproteobacteria bacterium]|jgi:flagellar hook-basal body complex protein FliE|nr:hypothetical protein [Deltaproteobacteria bacterium]